MEVLVTIDLVGNIIQLVDFSSKIISKSAQLYRSQEGAFAENITIETATNHLVLLSNKLKDDAASTTSDGGLQNLCESCRMAASDLLDALNKLKV